jgi:thiol-disulfide isomerase/thioredoxin
MHMNPWTRLRDAYRTRRLVRWSADLLGLLAIVLVAGLWQTRHHAWGDAPAFSLPALQGGPEVSLASLGGKPTMLVFWAPWCTVCKAESQNVSWVRSIVGSRANVVSVAASYRAVADVQAYVHEKGVDYPVVLGDDATVARFAVDAFPTVYFLDARGRISGSAVGYATTGGLLARLAVAGFGG